MIGDDIEKVRTGLPSLFLRDGLVGLFIGKEIIQPLWKRALRAIGFPIKRQYEPLPRRMVSSRPMRIPFQVVK